MDAQAERDELFAMRVDGSAGTSLQFSTGGVVHRTAAYRASCGGGTASWLWRMEDGGWRIAWRMERVDLSF